MLFGDTHLDHDGLRRYALGFEETFPDFAQWAAERHETDGLGRTPRKARETYFRLAERLDPAPVNGIGGRLFRLATFAGLYGKAKYGLTAQAWQSMSNGGETAKPTAAETTPGAGHLLPMSPSTHSAHVAAQLSPMSRLSRRHSSAIRS
ncbi:hypothetical protein AB0J91_22410, partial [Saccharopolyspora sp. NPDC049357]